MYLSNVLRKMALKNKAFAEMQADQARKLSAQFNDDDDDGENLDAMSDQVLEFHIITRELVYYHDNQNAYGKRLKREWKKARECAEKNDVVGFRDHRWQVENLCLTRARIAELERKLLNLARLYIDLADANDYALAQESLKGLVKLTEYMDKALDAMDKFEQYLAEKDERKREPERNREREYFREKEEEPEQTEEEWEMEL